MSEEFVVVHTEWGRHWSGGTQQVALLLEGLAQRGVKGCLVCQEGSMLAERMQGKVALKTFNLRGEHDLFTWRKFAQWLKVFKERQESLGHKLLVHVHSRKGALPTLLIAKRLKLKTVLHWRVAAPVRFPLGFTDAVIAVSDTAAQQILKGNFPAEKVAVVRSSIDTRFFEPFDGARTQMRNHLGLKEDGFIIAGMGRLVKGKGYEVLLKSLAELAPSDRPTLLLAGDGSERQKLEDLATGLGIAQQVKFLGFQSDVRPILWASDIFVHVPTTFPEGTPNAILEAMAAGLPVIATPVGGIPEVVRDGENGLLVPTNDHKALAEAILKLRQDETLRVELGKQAQKWVREHHDVRQLPERVIQVYNQVMAMFT
jgi:glycosyltransferase involved in cell wall biosynthesis